MNRLERRRAVVVLGFALVCMDRGDAYIDARRFETIFELYLRLLEKESFSLEECVFYKTDGVYRAIAEVFSSVPSGMLFIIPHRPIGRYYFDRFFKDYVFDFLEEVLEPDERRKLWDAAATVYGAYLNDTKYAELVLALSENEGGEVGTNATTTVSED